MATTTKLANLPLKPEGLVKSNTLWGDVWSRFRRHKLALGATLLLLFIILAITFGPLVWHTDPEYIDIVAAYSNMTAAHPFGADNLGRDTLARVIYGGRVSLAIGLVAMLISMSIGTLVGLLAGYFSILDNLLMRITDLFLSLPLLPLLLVITLLFRDSL